MEGKAPALADGRAMQQFSEDVRSRPEADLYNYGIKPIREADLARMNCQRASGDRCSRESTNYYRNE